MRRSRCSWNRGGGYKSGTGNSAGLRHRRDGHNKSKQSLKDGTFFADRYCVKRRFGVAELHLAPRPSTSLHSYMSYTPQGCLTCSLVSSTFFPPLRGSHLVSTPRRESCSWSCATVSAVGLIVRSSAPASGGGGPGAAERAWGGK